MGELARTLLMHPAGYPHSLIAVMMNQQIKGARATAKSVRWYACEMRKRGIQVPDRAGAHGAETDVEESAEWLASVWRVVDQGSLEGTLAHRTGHVLASG